VLPRLVRITLALSGFLLVPASTALADPLPLPGPAIGIVFIADGSGGLPGPSCDLSRLISCGCPGMRVDIYDWSHGWGLVLMDMYGHEHHRTKGRELACRIEAYRQACPSGRICLVGHSSGAAVILAAADCLQPGTVDRVILLAPAIGCNYDLRPALRAACEGIDVFYSHRDWISFSMNFAPTADLQWFAGAAGYYGFDPVLGGCGDEAALYANLRQYPGCHTGHFVCTKTAFLREHLLPLICMSSAPYGVPGMPMASGQAGGIRSVGYTSPIVAQSVAALEQLPPVDDIEETTPVPQGPAPSAGGGGIAPISEGLRIP
jgi:hypothetical protein